jgi:plastocyanin
VHKVSLILAVVGLGAAAVAPSAAGSGATVRVKDNKFVRKTLRIAAGTQVTWKFVGADAHNVTFKRFHSKTTSSGVFRHTFRKAGTFRYVCTLHDDDFHMVGKVVVS